MSSTFEPGTQRWVELLSEVRNSVRQHLVAQQVEDALASLSGGCKRVLDVGCGQGTQALRLARLGHEVVGLDTSRELLGRFEEALSSETSEARNRVVLLQGPGEAAPSLTSGAFDLVLCHGVLMYLERDAEMLSALTSVLAGTGILSLLVRNGAALAMRPGLLGQWQEVAAALSTVGYTNRLGVPARAHTVEQLDGELATLGLHRRAWWGVRVFSDHLHGQAPGDDELAALLTAEALVSSLDPYRQVAALTHLLYSR